MDSYVINTRRRLHEYPEIGFDLPRTLKLVRDELSAMGVEYTEQYGKSSIVATVNPEKSGFTIGIRADMDALPIKEATDLPFKSRLDGQMHACGHDAHTAILLDTCRRISAMKDKIACRVKFIFQAAEEYPPSGAKLMAEDGVMDGIDCIIALHVNTDYKAGEIALRYGARNATSDGFYLEFYGRPAHVAHQHRGVDAIMMAVKAYTEIEFTVAKEIKAQDAVIFNVGAIHGGTTNNVICDKCSMYCTLRTQSQENADHILGKIKKIISAVAETSGGKAEFIESKHYPIVINDDILTRRVELTAAKVVGEDKIFTREQGMGGEDFAYFANIKPGCMFELGVCPDVDGKVYGLHTDRLIIDESALSVGSDIFVQFVLDNMNGIKF
jgi:amidohydrolase